MEAPVHLHEDPLRLLVRLRAVRGSDDAMDSSSFVTKRMQCRDAALVLTTDVSRSGDCEVERAAFLHAAREFALQTFAELPRNCVAGLHAQQGLVGSGVAGDVTRIRAQIRELARPVYGDHERAGAVLAQDRVDELQSFGGGPGLLGANGWHRSAEWSNG
jgi:hypothetical protein